MGYFDKKILELLFLSEQMCDAEEQRNYVVFKICPQGFQTLGNMIFNRSQRDIQHLRNLIGCLTLYSVQFKYDPGFFGKFFNAGKDGLRKLIIRQHFFRI